jgi:hypothetical protein
VDRDLQRAAADPGQHRTVVVDAPTLSAISEAQTPAGPRSPS